MSETHTPREETENKSWYLVKAPTAALIEARLDGNFTANDLRIIANRVDLHNQVPLDK